MPFARDLHRHGDRLGVVAPDGTRLTYRQLASRVSTVAARLGTERRLVLIAAANHVEPLVTYLAALRGGHPVLLVAADDRHHLDTLISAYDPDVVLGRAGDGWRLQERRPGTAHSPHPQLALLLSTSGSTGSPKLVRLSADNLQANAASIAEYLGIRDTDRAVTSLPMHYCYGLSVINSNLVRGAALLLTDDSVVDRSFWDTVRAYRATSLHAVPYTFDLLDSVGFERMDLSGLRYVTQAGGRLAPDRVRRYAELAERGGWRLFVMYGQTEATARMAYLPPELVAAHPGAIGIPIPGGSFSLSPTEDPDEGELIYRGPNVMLGYARRPADLALGRTVDALPTGDIARRTPDGLYEIVGRRNRYTKLFGLRIDLAHVERVLEDSGMSAACTGSDDALIIAVLSPQDAAPVVDLVRTRFGLPASCVRVCRVAEFPRLTSGKIDYPAVSRLASAPSARSRPAPPRTIRQAFARVLNRTEITDDATFVSLGGDSLSYVQMSIELEKILGRVPDGWHTMPVHRLERLRPSAKVLPAAASLDTSIVLRALAITLIVGTHVGLLHVFGGAHLLLVIAGWSFARFLLAPEQPTGAVNRILRTGVRIAVPAALWLGFRAAVTDDVTVGNVLLVNGFLGQGTWGYWFVEVLPQILVVLAVVFAMPAVRRLERRHGFAVALVALVVAIGVCLATVRLGELLERDMTIQGVLWLFVLGWLAQRATTSSRKLVVLAIALTLVPSFFGDPVRELVVLAGLVLLLLVPRIPAPRHLARLLGMVAGASLYIYLTHYAIFPDLLRHLSPLVVLVISLVVGIVSWLVAQRCASIPSRLRRRRVA